MKEPELPPINFVGSLCKISSRGSKNQKGEPHFEITLLDVCSNQGAKPETGGTDSKCVCRVPLAFTLATALCKIHAALCWKIADVRGIEVYDVQL